MEQIDQHNRPQPEDELDSGDASSEESVDNVLNQALTGRTELGDDAEPSATYGSITSMEAQNQDTSQDRPETDPFADDGSPES